jgi:hypothetical protein
MGSSAVLKPSYLFGAGPRRFDMTGSPRDPESSLADAVKTSWHRFLDVYEPLRPELYRYCRYGAVKAALHRGRGKLAELDPPEPEPATPAVLDAFCAAFNANGYRFWR